MIAVPAVGARKPVIIFIVVDLPAPFGPRKPSTSPLRHGEGDVVDRLERAEMFDEMSDLQHSRMPPIADWRLMLPSVQIAETLYQHDGRFVPFRPVPLPRGRDGAALG